MKTALFMLVLAVLGLGAALWHQQRSIGQRLAHARTDALRWSNRWQQSQETLSVAAQTSARYQSTILMRETQLAMTSNDLVRATNALAQAGTVVADMQAEAEAAAAELWERDTQMLDRQAQLRQLESNLAQLRAAQAELADRLAATTNELAQQERAVAALKLERELMFKRGGQLEGDVELARAELAELRRQFQSLQAQFLPDSATATTNLAAALAARFQALEQEVLRLQTQWNDPAAVRTQLQVLEREPAVPPPPASEPPAPLE